MKLVVWLLGVLILCKADLQAVGFERLTDLTSYLAEDVVVACDDLLFVGENIPVYELYLQGLWNWPYVSILSTPWSQKKAIVDQFIVNYCSKTSAKSGMAVVNRFIDQNHLNILTLVKDRDFFKDLDYGNLTFIEYLMQTLGVPYRNLLQMNAATKQAELLNLLAFGSSSAFGPSIWSIDSTSSATITSTALAQGGAGGKAVELPPVGPVRGGPVWLDNPKTDCVFFNVLPVLGTKKSFCLLDNLEINVVQLSAYPVVGKYMDGYPIADLNVIIKNNFINDSLLSRVPANILAVIPAGYQTDFYTEISSWNRSNAENVSFEAKDRQFNLLFHGTMMDWFATKYPTFNFDNDSQTENFDIGVFNSDGIARVAAMGSDGLVPVGVTPHNNRYSSDDARFTVAPGRNILTWWSVAVSEPAKRAVVTYHVLINQEVQADLVANLKKMTEEAGGIADLMTGLNALAKVGGADGAAWEQAIKFLSELYRA